MRGMDGIGVERVGYGEEGWECGQPGREEGECECSGRPIFIFLLKKIGFAP